MVKDAAAKYLRTQVETASPEQLVTMLYDGALRFGDLAAEVQRSLGYYQSLNRDSKV